MDWIYLSPHLDDAVFSCGGLIWEQTARQKKVEIWTVCAGDVPEGPLSDFAEKHHQRWETGQNAVAIRKQEDAKACERVGAAVRHFSLPDCIYRRAGVDYLSGSPSPVKPRIAGGRHLYITREDLFGPIHPAEFTLIQDLGKCIAAALPEDASVVCPMAVGGHVDHRLTLAAAQTLQIPRLYYMDFPYVLKDIPEVEGLTGRGWQSRLYEISREGFEAWFESIAAHQSQISTFWDDLADMRADLEQYLKKSGGIQLWQSSSEGSVSDSLGQDDHVS